MTLSSSKPLSLFIIALLFTFSQISQARDSQFFSKVSSVKNDNDHKKTTPTTTTTEINPENTNNDDETEGFEKEEDPTFTNDSQNEGYGLYGHESGQNPPFAEQKHFTTKTTTNSPVSNYNNFGRQGMSDTRFMANGKYFHDVSSEKTTAGYDPASFAATTTSYDEKNYDPNSYKNDEESNENDNKAVDYTNPKNWYSNRERNNRRYGQNSLTDNNNNNNYKAVDYSNPRNRYNNDNNRGNGNSFYERSNNVNDNKQYNDKDVDYTNPKNWYNNRENDNSFNGGDNNSNNDNENYYYKNNDEKNGNSFEGYQNEGQNFQENQEFVP